MTAEPAPEYASLSARAQVLRLHVAAREVLHAWPVTVARLRLVHHAFNTTFRVDTTDGRTFALRLSVNSHKPEGVLLAETAWMHALAEETDILVPAPQRTVAGGFTAQVAVPSLGRTVNAAMFSWLRGSNIERVAGPMHLHEVGRTMARLHTHAETWVMPEGAWFPPVDREWDTAYPMLASDHPLLTDERREVFDATLALVRAAVREVSAAGPHHALHADLHLGNAKWYRGRLSVFDFDDCQWGPRAHDLAITTYYIQLRPELVDALRTGYTDVRSLPEISDEHFQALLAARNVLLVDEVINSVGADFLAILPTYVANTELKLRHFLATGAYRHDVEGVTPLW